MYQKNKSLIIALAVFLSALFPSIASAQNGGYQSAYDKEGKAYNSKTNPRPQKSNTNYAPKSTIHNSYGASENIFTFGYKIGGMGLPGLNNAVAAYNADRAWLSPQMPKFGLLKGWEASWQFRGGKWGFEVVMSKISEKNEAKGIEPSTSKMGYRRAQVSMGGVGMGVLRSIYDRGHITILPALDFDAYWFSGASYYSTTESYKGVTTKNDVSKIMLANTLSLNVRLYLTNWLGINLKPYVQIAWGKENLQGIVPYNTAITAQDDRPMNAGASASLIIALGR